MTALEAAAVVLHRAQRDVEKKRTALAEARRVLNARLADLERAIRGRRRQAA